MKGFVESYKTCLENRIEHGDSILVCGDRELIGEVGGLLQDRDAPNIHSLLGLNPLKVMEESLLSMQSSLPTTHGPHCIAKGGIGGLAKAFEVLELAALNLYLGPWRKEFKLVKMYSGMFTHHVKPVLSMPQILELFGLLGYEAGPTRCEELRLSSVGSSDSFRGLSFAFFAARCECRLLLTALGNHVGAMEWELGLVRERLKGRTLQVALDNTTRRLEASEPPEGDPLELSDVDLYTDDGQEEKRQEGERRQGVGETPRSPSWAERSSIVTSFSTPAAVTHSNGVPPSSSTPTSPREPVCVSTFNCQLAKTSPSGVSSSTAKSSPATATYTQQSGNFNIGIHI
ncbi:spermatogenesis associated 2-like [Aplochiton taeniatus]